MPTFRQLNFSSGEISPSLYGRVDTGKYASGLRTLRNIIVQRHGGGANRPGTEFVCEVANSATQVRLIPFIFNSSQTYVLEFGNEYMRVIQSGTLLTNTAQNITGISQANPGVVTINSHGYQNGDEVYISGVVGMTELNNRYLIVRNRTTNTFTLEDKDGNAVNTTSYTAYSSGGTAASIYSITTPYQVDDLMELQFTQSADVITIVHQNYKPYELSRSGHTSWTLSAITFAPVQAAPTSPTASGGGGSGYDYYKVTAINKDTLEESLPTSAAQSTVGTATSAAPVDINWTTAANASRYNIYKRIYGTIYGLIGTSEISGFVDNGITADVDRNPPVARDPFELETSVAISGITQADPGVVTTAAHGYSTGDLVYIESVSGMTEVNNTYFYVTVLSSTTFSLQDLAGDDVDTSGYTAYSSSGTVKRAHNYPGAVSYIQQRLSMGNTKNNPEGIWMSRTGRYKNFTNSYPTQSDDSITARITGRQINTIRHIIDAGKPVILTQSGEHALLGDSGGVISPTDLNPRQFTYNGSATVSPVVVDGDIIYIQGNKKLVTSMAYTFEADGYRGSELSIFSGHLVEKNTIVDAAYQKDPNSIVWLVRDDGILLGITYVRDQQIVGWHRHDFDLETGVLDGSTYAGGGTAFRGIERVCVVPENDESVLYVVIKRSVNGYVKRYIERMETRNFAGKTVSALFKSDIKDGCFLDCSSIYDGRNADTTLTMTLSGGTNWTYDETLTLTAASSYFVSTDVDKQVHLYGSDDSIIRFTITGYTSGTVVTGRANKTVPAAMRSTAIAKWGKALNTVTGAWSLNGESVAVFADGFVVANPNNPGIGGETVTNGTVTLDDYYTYIRVGIPYYCDMETLNIDTVSSETLIDKNKSVGSVTLMLEDSRGVWVGPKPPSDDDTDPLEGLTEAKFPDDASLDGPQPMTTGEIEVIIQAEWNSNGRVFIRQVDPVPLKILAVAPSVTIGG